MDYLIFNENQTYTNEQGEACELGEHLNYLRTWGGTPDCWDSAPTLQEAKRMCYREPRTLVVISEVHDYRPVHRSVYEPENVNFGSVAAS